ncbi:MAG: toll/interleukin-1 receptor domain-containing protein [Rhodocyclaceae bacterium]|nr:toll/interleukin-1 receptor domain-containing protein [Rhodocyclaceae bacterium]
MKRKLFLSYASSSAALAERLELALEAEGWDVFRDRSDLPPGEAYDARIAAAVEAAERFVFLITPDAVAPGRYTLSELEFARRRWPQPSGRVLPVIVAPTPLADIPAYLKAVTFLQPQGEIAAEVVAALRQPAGAARRGKPVALLAGALLLLLGGGGYYWRVEAQKQESARAQAARVDAALAGAGTARDAGNYAAAWDTLERAAAQLPQDLRLARAREDLAMDWLQNIRSSQVASGRFSDIVQRLVPVIEAGAAGRGARAADLTAHLGWAQFLQLREGAAGLDPTAHYRRAVELDPANPYGHAMWGFELLRTRAGFAAAEERFGAALAGGRERDYVRRMQFAGYFWVRDPAYENAAVAVADAMRRAGETLPVNTPLNLRDRLWNLYQDRLVNGYERASFLAALAPDAQLQTFLWLFPKGGGSRQRHLYLSMLAQLQENAGDIDQARRNYAEARKEVNAQGSAGGALASLLDAAAVRLGR